MLHLRNRHHRNHLHLFLPLILVSLSQPDVGGNGGEGEVFDGSFGFAVIEEVRINEVVVYMGEDGPRVFFEGKQHRGRLSSHSMITADICSQKVYCLLTVMMLFGICALESPTSESRLSSSRHSTTPRPTSSMSSPLRTCCLKVIAKHLDDTRRRNVYHCSRGRSSTGL